MFLKLQLTVPACHCVSSRFALLSWGYGKIIIDIVLMPIVIGALLETIYNIDIYEVQGPVVFSILLAVVTIDIVFHAILVAGVHKQSMKLLQCYCKYIKILWALKFIVPATLMICYWTGLWDDNLSRGYLHTQLVACVTVIVVTLACQTFLLLVVKREIIKMHEKSTVGYSIPDSEYTVRIEFATRRKPNDGITNYTDIAETNTEATVA